MKQIEFDPDFKRNLQKRFQNTPVEDKIKERIDMFLNDRSNPLLKDHPLKGEMGKYRSFSISGDIRIIYFEEKNKIVFLDVGKHTQVY